MLKSKVDSIDSVATLRRSVIKLIIVSLVESWEILVLPDFGLFLASGFLALPVKECNVRANQPARII